MKSVRYIIGGLLIPIGFYLGFVAIGSINAPTPMYGPIGVGLIYYLLIKALWLAMGFPLLYYGLALARVPSGWISLLLAFVSGGWVIYNLWFHPPFDGSYDLLRYGRGWITDSLAPEGPWHHFAAFTCILLFLYWGLTGTFRQAFSSDPDSIQGAIRYRRALVLLAIGLFLVLGYLYILFVDSLGSAAFTAWQQNMIVATSFLVPIGCLLVGLALKGYRKIALMLLLAGSGMLLLVTITFLAYNLVLWQLPWKTSMLF